MRRLRVTVASRRLLFVALGLLLASSASAFLATQVPAVRAYILRGVESRLTHYVGREVRFERLDFRPLQGELDLHNVRVASGSGPAGGTLLAARPASGARSQAGRILVRCRPHPSSDWQGSTR